MRILVWTPIVLAVATDAAYLAIIYNQRTQDGPPPGDVITVPFVASYIALTVVMLWVSLQTRAVLVRSVLRSGAAAGLLVLGVLGAFSIGLPLLIAGVVAVVATVITVTGAPSVHVIGSASAAAVLAVAVLLVGFELTARVIVCPDSGSSSGAWNGMLTRGFTWDCVGGRLIIHDL